MTTGGGSMSGMKHQPKHTQLLVEMPPRVLEVGYPVEGPTAYKSEVVFVNRRTHADWIVLAFIVAMMVAFLIGYESHAQTAQGINGGSASVATRALSSGSLVLPSQAGRIPVQTLQMPTTGWTTYNVYGDSISAGSDATTTANRYSQIIAAAVGSPTVNTNAVSGMYSCDMPNVVLADDAPAVSDATLRTMMIGINDATIANPVGVINESTFNNCLLAAASWLTIPSTLKTAGSSISLPSNFTADTTYAGFAGIQSHTNGSTAVFPYTTTTEGQTVFVWYRLINSNGGQFSVSDTGGATTQTGFGSTINNLNLQSGLGYSVGVVVLYNQTRAAGTYNATVTVTSATGASNIVSILGIGLAPPTGATGSPSLYLSGVTRMLFDSAQSATTEYDRDVQLDVSLLNQYGLVVNYVPVNNYFFGTLNNNEMGLGSAISGQCPVDAAGYFKHPCNYGQAEIANAFLGRNAIPNYDPLPAANDPTQYTAVNLYTSNQTLTCANQLVIVNDASSSAMTMPSYCTPGKKITILNIGAGVVSFTQTISGGGNSGSFLLYQNQTADLYAYPISGTGAFVGSAWYTGTTQVPSADVATVATTGTSATCNLAHCVAAQGTFTLVAGASLTTGTIATVSWTAVPLNWYCAASQNGGATFYGIGNSVATSTGLTITAAVSVANATVVINWECQSQDPVL